MLLVPVVGWDAASGAPVLTQKGYGYNNGSSFTLAYANVTSGSAPSAGDFVFWEAINWQSGGTSMVDVTGSGWAQHRVSEGNGAHTILAKVVAAGDISSPATISNFDGCGMWVAYSLEGSVSNIVVSGTFDESGNSAPANRSLNLSALDAPLIASSISLGYTTALASWSGATPDYGNLQSNVMMSSLGEVSQRWKNYASGVGDNITISKADTGNPNALGAGYVQVS